MAAPRPPVSVVVPFAAGSTPDLVARIVADRLLTQLGKPAVVENKGGAAGNIGTSTTTSYLESAAGVLEITVDTRERYAWKFESQQAQTTKQAMGQLVDALERGGYVERIADPVDRRVKQIRLTARGWAARRPISSTSTAR